METTAQSSLPVSNATLWAGRILSLLPTLFMIMDGGMKLFNPPPVRESMAELGYPAHVTFGIGVLALVCVVLYLLPNTSILGVVLLTGYLGGAVATQIRIDAPLFSLLFPITIGALFWAGLYLREPRLRALVPFIQNRNST